MVVIVAGRGLGLRPSRELDLYGEASGLKLRKLEKSRRRAFFDVTLISFTATSVYRQQGFLAHGIRLCDFFARMDIRFHRRWGYCQL